MPRGIGLAEATSVVERAVDRTVLRGRRGLDRRGPPGQRARGDPAGRRRVRRHGAIAYRNEVAAGYLTARHGEALVEEAIAELAEDGRRRGRAQSRPVAHGRPVRTAAAHARAPGDPPAAGRVAAWASLVVIDDVTDRRRLEAVRRDFVANISHELKTPVGALALLAETLLAEDDAAVAQRLAERMLTEAFRVGRTIDDLLELSRIEADEEARREDVPVHRLIAEAVDRVRPAAEQQGIAIEVEEPAARLAVAGDRRQLVSATYNLLENAVKYSDRGSTVQVRARTDGRWVDIEVAGPRHRDPPAATSSGCSSASTGSTGPAAARPAAPASAWPSCATSPATTPARSGSSPSRAKDPRSPCDCRWVPGPSPSPQRQADAP